MCVAVGAVGARRFPGPELRNGEGQSTECHAHSINRQRKDSDARNTNKHTGVSAHTSATSSRTTGTSHAGEIEVGFDRAGSSAEPPDMEAAGTAQVQTSAHNVPAGTRSSQESGQAPGTTEPGNDAQDEHRFRILQFNCTHWGRKGEELAIAGMRDPISRGGTDTAGPSHQYDVVMVSEHKLRGTKITTKLAKASKWFNISCTEAPIKTEGASGGALIMVHKRHKIIPVDEIASWARLPTVGNWSIAAVRLKGYTIVFISMYLTPDERDINSVTLHAVEQVIAALQSP